MGDREEKLGLFFVRRISLCIIFLFLGTSAYSQITTMFNGQNKIQSKKEIAALYSVNIYPEWTEVTIELIPTKNQKRMNYYSSKNTVITIEGLELPILGFLEYNNGEKTINAGPFSGSWGWNNVKAGKKYYYTMIFKGSIPLGATNISIVDRGEYILNEFTGIWKNCHGYSFSNCKLNNPRFGATTWTESSIKQNADENNDGICGIYETTQGAGYKLGCVKENGTYYLIYLGSSTKKSWWQEGDIKASLSSSATSGYFKGEWLMLNKSLNNDVYVIFDGRSMKTIINTDNDTEEDFYLKMYPSSSSSGFSQQMGIWSGTGCALNNGYIVTNYHVVENAKNIKVKGVGGNVNVEYEATVVSTDTHNDLAIIKISDSRFKGFGTVPYRVKTTISEVGENIFVLGYPLTTTMGDEIKLTTGVISARTGFQGDVSLYQISAPIQPGNSGGPLFDGQGNLIGIVNAKHTGAENVGYAIKTSYLQNLVTSSLSNNVLPTNNTISGLSLSEKVKKLKNFTFMITCSSQASITPSNTNNVTSITTPSSNHSSTGTNIRTINFPLDSINYASTTRIEKVVINSAYTSICLNYTSFYENGWCNIDKNTYILVNGQRYTMTRAEGINIAPAKTNLNIGEGRTFTLYFPAIPSNATTMDLIESDESSWRFYGININANDDTSSQLTQVTLQPTGYINGYGYVDLGLSVKWATCNIGASSPSDCGNYYAWGETSTKSFYTSDNSVTNGKNMSSIAGNSNYDAARANWGGKWRLPTKEEIDELGSKCERVWIAQGGYYGYRFIGPNGNSIFLPASGSRAGSALIFVGWIGLYWSATPGENNNAYPLYLSEGHFEESECPRFSGFSVRPVIE